MPRTRAAAAAGLAAAGLAVAVLASGCSGGRSDEVATPVGCGMVRPGRLVSLLGDHAVSTAVGSTASLRRDHRALSCRSTGRSVRAVEVTAAYHPRPYELPARQCGAGWVYAGTPDHYAPACQETEGGTSRTLIVVRWQPYLMRVRITRPDRDWAGDPEVGLAMTQDLARELGVAAAQGSG